MIALRKKKKKRGDRNKPPCKLGGGGIMAPPTGLFWVEANGFEAIFPALNAAAEMKQCRTAQ